MEINMKKTIITLLALLAPLYAQTIDNFDFTTVSGTKYNLYNDLLSQKKPVLFHTMTSS